MKQQQLIFSQTHPKEMAIHCITTETTTLVDQFAQNCINQTITINIVYIIASWTLRLMGPLHQWRLRHSGSSDLARVFDYDLYCRTWAGLLCIVVPSPISLIKLVNSGFFHWTLLLFIHFRSMSGLCRWPESKSIVCGKRVLSTLFARALLGIIR